MNLLIQLKIHEFRRDNIKTIDHRIFKEYLDRILWKGQSSIDTLDLIDQVMGISSAEIFDYLGVKAIKDGSTMNLSDFIDLINR